LDVINRLINQALAGLNYLLTIAVSVIVIVIAIVVFRSLVGEPDAAAVTTTTTSRPPVTTIAVAAAPAVTGVDVAFACNRQAPTEDEGTRVVRLFYSCGFSSAPTGATWVYRVIDAEADALTATLQEFLAGPNPMERSDGYRSLFSAATAGALLSVTREAGGAIVDLRDLGPVPSLSVETEAASFLADLNNTVFQQEDVSAIEYRIENTCDRFWAYFDESGCRIVTRAEWEQNPAAAK
jgi:hypothetical protein